MATVAVVHAITAGLLAIKVFAFFPDNLWLIKSGRLLVAHGNHTGTSTERLEATGCLTACSDCGAQFRRRPSISLRRPVARRAMRTIASRISSRFAITSGMLLRTPVLAVVAFGSASWWTEDADRWVLLTVALLAGLLAVQTLMASVILRLSLGPHDVSYSDIRSFKRVLPGGTARPRETLAIYFASLVLVSILLYSSLYTGLHRFDPQAFESTKDVGWLDWYYYSVGVASTSADGSIRALSALAKISVMVQLATGPLLLFWFVSLFLTDSSGDVVE